RDRKLASAAPHGYDNSANPIFLDNTAQILHAAQPRQPVVPGRITVGADIADEFQSERGPALHFVPERIRVISITEKQGPLHEALGTVHREEYISPSNEQEGQNRQSRQEHIIPYHEPREYCSE